MAMKRGRGGVEYDDIKLGDGPTAHRGTRVEVRYNLFLNRGDQVQENQLYSFRVGKRRVIPGLEYGVEGMRVGGGGALFGGVSVWGPPQLRACPGRAAQRQRWASEGEPWVGEPVEQLSE